MAMLRREEQEAYEGQESMLSSIEASFAMAASLRCQDPLLGRLNRGSLRLIAARMAKTRLQICLHSGTWIFPLILMALVLSIPSLASLSGRKFFLKLLLLLDAIFLGMALAPAFVPRLQPFTARG